MGSEHATPSYAILAYYFELKALEKQEVQEELSDLHLSTKKQIIKFPMRKKGTLSVPGREEHSHYWRPGVNTKMIYKPTY